MFSKFTIKNMFVLETYITALKKLDEKNDDDDVKEILLTLILHQSRGLIDNIDAAKCSAFYLERSLNLNIKKLSNEEERKIQIGIQCFKIKLDQKLQLQP
jgi:hypothetical protein